MGSFKKNWADLGFPLFAQNSIDANRTAVEEATRVGEYMVGTLIENRYFNHNVLSTLLRLTTKARRDEWLGDRINTSAPGNPVIKCGLCSMHLPFKKHSAASLIDDQALLDQLRLKAGVPSQTWKNQAPSATCCY